MAFLPHTHVALKWPAPPQKRARRTATSVLAGDFDHRPRVDVLTSLLNGVKPYRPPLSEEQLKEKEELKEKRRLQHLQMAEEREAKKKEKAERKERDKMLMKAAAAERELVNQEDLEGSASAALAKSREERANSFWQALPPKYPVDLTDPTPEPSDDESLFSRASSKRPHTPYDDESVGTSSIAPLSPQLYPTTSVPKRATSPPVKRGPGRPPKRRKLEEQDVFVNPASGSTASADLLPGTSIIKKRPTAVKKGWKGWVEAEEDELPKDKLIELDSAIILQDRRTRSGKNFDAISEGKDTWV